MSDKKKAVAPDSPEPAEEKKAPIFFQIENLSGNAHDVKAEGKKAFIEKHKGTVMFDLADAYEYIVSKIPKSK